jgi:hypothetical protein
MPTEKRTVPTDPINFKAGAYQHFKGAFYSALFIGWEHEFVPQGCLLVAYVSMTTGKIHFRPWCLPEKDSWTDEVLVNGVWRPRFRQAATASLHPYEMTTPETIVELIQSFIGNTSMDDDTYRNMLAKVCNHLRRLPEPNEALLGLYYRTQNPELRHVWFRAAMTALLSDTLDDMQALIEEISQ